MDERCNTYNPIHELHLIRPRVERRDNRARLWPLQRQQRAVGDLADFDTIAAETSHLADALISHALEKLHSWAVKRRGTPIDACTLALPDPPPKPALECATDDGVLIRWSAATSRRPKGQKP